MKISELMEGKTPDPEFEGWVTNDDMVLAINTKNSTGTTPDLDFSVLQMGVDGLDAQMNPITQDKTYIRAGQSTQKTGTQRAFSVTGDKYIGDDALDYVLSHKIKYGTGNSVVTDYIYFNLLTGLGEKGTASIIVNSDGGGAAGESAAIDIELRKIGAMPVEWDFASAGTTEEPEEDF